MYPNTYVIILLVYALWQACWNRMFCTWYTHLPLTLHNTYEGASILNIRIYVSLCDCLPNDTHVRINFLYTFSIWSHKSKDITYSVVIIYIYCIAYACTLHYAMNIFNNLNMTNSPCLNSYAIMTKLSCLLMPKRSYHIRCRGDHITDDHRASELK